MGEVAAALTEPSGTYVYLITAPLINYRDTNIYAQILRYRLDNWTLEASLTLDNYKFNVDSFNACIGTFLFYGL